MFALWAALIALLLAALPLPGATVTAQEQDLTVNVAGFEGEDWPQAQAIVTVLGGDERPVAGLDASQFAVQLNGSSVPVAGLTRAEDSTLPIDVVLTLDVSGSMAENGALEQAKVAARQFLAGLGPNDTVAIITFNDTVQQVLPFTQDREQAAAAIDGLTADGATALYQATAASAELAAGAGSGRRAVVLLSDGLDNGSTLTREEAVSTVDTLGVPLFVIGLGAELDRDYLQELADTTGGRFAETPSPEGLSELYQSVGEQLRGQYLVTVDASNLDLPPFEPATLRVDVAAGELSGSAERAVCPQALCLALRSIEDGERLDEARTVVAEVVSEEPVVSVAFLVDGSAVAELSEPPYEFTFDPGPLPEGEHALAAQVTTSGDQTLTGEVTVRVGVSAGGGLNTNLLAIAVLAVAAGAGAAIVFFLARRRRGGTEDEPVGPDTSPEPPLGPAAGRGPGAHLWPQAEEALPPPLPPEEALGRLRATSGPLAGEAFPVGGAPVSIGSGHRCLVRLPEQTDDGKEIASEHTRVWVRGGQLMLHEVRRLTAYGSEGGRWKVLSPGDAFSVGPCTFQFDLGEEAAGGQAPAGATNVLPSQPPAVSTPQDLPDIWRDKDDSSGEPSAAEAANPASELPPTEERLPTKPAGPADGIPQFPGTARARADER